MKGKAICGAVAVACLLAGSAIAEPTDLTGTGGGPASAAKAPFTATTGATVPRPGSVGTQEKAIDGVRRRDAERDKKADAVMRGICIGC